MRIAETFHSIQGEGQLTGVPTTFVRTTGCNLRCWFCDTPYTSWQPEGEHHTWQDVREIVRGYECEHVVITGGEPLLQPDVVPLTRALTDAGHHITIETAGTVHRPVAADLMSISPKMTNSTPRSGRWAAKHEQIRDQREVVARMAREYHCQFKFVVDTPADLNEIEAYLATLPDVISDHVWLMPQARTAEELHERQSWLSEAAEVRGYHISPRLHIELFGNVRGK